ncbi:hypothetical protein [Sorangium atrum]|uniref:MarR family transcriptional regulator n=1 Tax=Sorangium atrum TaxID=2995308 RepID=A0ABT5BZZ9_9BACT|nr:hypothetical protein [Sorangium aterium]MDC0679691.1 hypothetical protein [Sorangium aterium]
MSHGIGSAQRDLVATLADHPAGLSLRRLRRLHPRHVRRSLRALVARGVIKAPNNTGETMDRNVLQANLNIRVNGELRAEIEAVSGLMSRDGLTVKRAAVARSALVRGLRVMRDELTRAAASAEVA